MDKITPLIKFLQLNKKRIFILIFLFVVIEAYFYNPDENLGNGWFYCKNRHDILGNTINIAPYILNYNHDKDFIIVKQYKAVINAPVEYRIQYKYPSQTGVFYFIIDKKNKQLYGPLLYDDFNLKCDSLKLGIIFERSREKQIPNKFIN